MFTAKITALMLATILLFNSCKKGEDDPFFSFRTRKNRVVGKWKLTKGSYKHTTSSTSSAPEGEAINFTDNQYTYIMDVPGSIYPLGYQGSYGRWFTFEKNGTVTMIETVDGLSTTIHGTWDFNSGVGLNKGKEQIIVHFKNSTGSSGTKTYSGNQIDNTFSIKELRNNKMVLTYQIAILQADGTREEVLESIELKQ